MIPHFNRQNYKQKCNNKLINKVSFDFGDHHMTFALFLDNIFHPAKPTFEILDYKLLRAAGFVVH